MCLKAVPAEANTKGKKKGGKATKGKGKKKAMASEVMEADEEDTEATQEPARKRRKLQEFDSESTLIDSENPDLEGDAGEAELQLIMVEERGSGYPSGMSNSVKVSPVHFALIRTSVDPKTQAYLKAAFDPIYGYPSIVRFSWGTVKIAMDKNGIPCTW
jgi:outer membrane protein OmpA-like peptidoglycan-associated protein